MCIDAATSQRSRRAGPHSAFAKAKAERSYSTRAIRSVPTISFAKASMMMRLLTSATSNLCSRSRLPMVSKRAANCCGGLVAATTSTMTGSRAKTTSSNVAVRSSCLSAACDATGRATYHLAAFFSAPEFHQVRFA